MPGCSSFSSCHLSYSLQTHQPPALLLQTSYLWMLWQSPDDQIYLVQALVLIIWQLGSSSGGSSPISMPPGLALAYRSLSDLRVRPELALVWDSASVDMFQYQPSLRHSSIPISPEWPFWASSAHAGSPDTDNLSHLHGIPTALPHAAPPRWVGHLPVPCCAC